MLFLMQWHYAQQFIKCPVNPTKEKCLEALEIGGAP